MAVRTLDIKLVGHNELGAATREADRDLRRLTMEAERSAQRFQKRMARDFSVPRTQGLMDRRNLVASRTVEDQLYREVRAIELRRVREETMRAARESRMQLIQQRVRADLGLETAAAVQREKIVGEAVKKEAMRQGQQAAAARTGMIGGFSRQQMQLLIRGGAVTMAGMTLGQVTDKMVEMRDLAADGKAHWTDITLEIGKSIPLLGGFVRAGENINELFTGTKREVQEIARHADMIAGAIDIHRKAFFETRAIREQTAMEGTARSRDIARIGMPEPSASIQRYRDQLKTLEEQSRARQQAEIQAILDESAEAKTIAELRRELNKLVPPDEPDMGRQRFIDPDKPHRQAAERKKVLKRRADIKRQIAALEEQQDQAVAAVTDREEQILAQARAETAKNIGVIERQEAQKSRAERMRFERQEADARRAHARTIEDIQRESAERRTQAEADLEAMRLRAMGRTHEAELAELREQGRRRQVELDRQQAEARRGVEDAWHRALNQFRGSAVNLFDAARTMDGRHITDTFRRELMVRHITDTFRREWMASQEAMRGLMRQWEIAGAVGEATDAERQAAQRMEAERRALLTSEAEKSVRREIMDMQMRSLDTMGEQGRMEAEKLRIADEYLRKQERLEQISRDMALSAEVRAEAEKMLAKLDTDKASALARIRPQQTATQAYVQSAEGYLRRGAADYFAELSRKAGSETMAESPEVRATRDVKKVNEDQLKVLNEMKNAMQTLASRIGQAAYRAWQ